MRKTFSTLHSLFLIAAAICLYTGCTETNTIPDIGEIITTDTRVSYNQTIELSIDLSDSHQREYILTWVTDKGSIDFPDRQTIHWTAPAEDCLVRLIVFINTDGMYTPQKREIYLLVGDFTLTAPGDDRVIYFSDPDLKQLVLQRINKTDPPILFGDVKGITSFSASLKGITNLLGMESFDSLTSLHMPYNNIKDISPLAGLTNLETLSLPYNTIEEINGLAKLQNLKKLYLYYNFISDISVLSGLSGLHTLLIHYNDITRIDALKNLSNLKDLRLNWNYISDLNPISALTSLTDLYLGNNNITDISPIGGLTALTLLHATNNRISDISSLTNLKALQHLELGYNKIGDLSPLQNLPNLRYLNVYGNGINNIDALKNLKSLNYLSLGDNNVSDISPLSGLTALTVISFNFNPIGNSEKPLANLEQLTRLNELHLYYTKITSEDLPSLSKLTSLQYLRIDNNSGITDISPLITLKSLHTLRINDTQVADFTPLLELNNLVELYAAGTPVSEGKESVLNTLEARGVRVYR